MADPLTTRLTVAERRAIACALGHDEDAKKYEITLGKRPAIVLLQRRHRTGVNQVFMGPMRKPEGRLYDLKGTLLAEPFDVDSGILEVGDLVGVGLSCFV